MLSINVGKKPDFLHEVVPRSMFYQRTLVFTLCWKLNNRARFMVISSEQVFLSYNHILPSFTCTAMNDLFHFFEISRYFRFVQLRPWVSSIYVCIEPL